MENNIYGNWATLLLPLNDDESINFEQYVKEINYLINCKVNGIYSNGTAGEFISQSEEEFQELTRIFATLCNEANMPFQIGCSHPSCQTSFSRIAFASQFKPTAIQVILPEWFPLTNKEAIKFLQKASDIACGIPLTLYNPPHAKRRLSPSDFIEIIHAVPTIKSIKVCDGNDEWYESMKEVLQMTAVFVPGHHLATGYKHGAKGAYSNVACISPIKAQKWYDLMVTDLDKALIEEKNIQKFMSLYIDNMIIKEHHANFVIDKFLAVVGGYMDISNVARFPYERVDPNRATFVREKLIEIAPFFADDCVLQGST